MIFVPHFVVLFPLTKFVYLTVGMSDAPAGKPTELAPQKISRAPKAPSSKVPTSHTAAISSDTSTQTAPDHGMPRILLVYFTVGPILIASTEMVNHLS